MHNRGTDQKKKTPAGRTTRNSTPNFVATIEAGQAKKCRFARIDVGRRCKRRRDGRTTMAFVSGGNKGRRRDRTTISINVCCAYLELPVGGLQQLLGLVPRASGGQHELVDHHLFAQRVHGGGHGKSVPGKPVGARPPKTDPVGNRAFSARSLRGFFDWPASARTV